MAYGLKVLNASGDVRLDTSDRMIRYHSVVSGTITQSSSPISVYVAGIQNNGTWGVSNDVPLSGSYSSSDDVKVEFGATNYLTLTIQHSYTGDFAYRIQIFRI